MANVRFTTKSAIMDGIRFKAQYSLADDETLTVKLIGESAPMTLVLNKGDEHYLAARAAYEEKAAKRAGAGAVDQESYAGMKLKGGWFTIFYDASIDRCTITFRKKPAAEIRELVKAYGFWWTPSHKCWSRKMNSTAWWAGQELYKKLAA